MGGWKEEPYPSMSTTGRIVSHRPNRRMSTGENLQNLRAPAGKDVHCLSYEQSTTPEIQPRKNRKHPDL